MKPQDAQDYLSILQIMGQREARVQDLPEYMDPRLATDPGVPAPRSYSVPSKEDNPLNAWSHRVRLAAELSARGTGKSLAIKDTVSVAGIPLTCGTEPYHLSSDGPYPIPLIDAPVVTRVLEAGGTIKGISTCENYCMSGLSFTSATGPVDNPWLKGYSAGGSSSGSAALVAIPLIKAWREKHGLEPIDLGEGVDMALGGDQGGSIRLPSAFSGVYGLKQTHGLVPYTAVSSLHPAIDHCGPICGSIRDCAVLLSAIAGYDGIDPRQTPETPLRQNVPAYHELLDRAIETKKERGEWTPEAAAKGLRIGILKEGFELPELDPEVDSVVRKAALKFAQLGATVEEVSIPLHADGMSIWSGFIQSQMADVFVSNKAADLLSYSQPNLAPPTPTQAWYDQMTVSNPAVVASLFQGDFTAGYPQRIRSKAVMHAHQLRAAYNEALEKYDVLITPTIPTAGPPHVPRDASVLTKFMAALGVSGNTGPFNVTGHPALSIPAGWVSVKNGEGKLPVGMQITGKRWDEVGVLFAASAWEVGGHGLDAGWEPTTEVVSKL
ncbi:amidase [Thozetella sp. PMI_491]|nr:amidase [Thozetella sp. PMI_491]